MNRDMTAKRLREVLHYDPETGVFTWTASPSNAVSDGSVAGSINTHGYRVIEVDSQYYKAHRLAWLYMTGEWPADQIDHANRVQSDDRWENLREATPSQNMANRSRPKHNTSGYKGVSWRADCSKWRASIGVNGHRISLGLHDTPEAAHIAYAEAAHRFHGEFARTE